MPVDPDCQNVVQRPSPCPYPAVQSPVEIVLKLFRSAFRQAADVVVRNGFSTGESGLVGWADNKFTKHLGGIGLGACQWADLSYAVGSLYRHHIELLLKVLILLGRRLAGEGSSFPKEHDLRVLWAEARGAIANNPDESIRISLEDANQRIGKLADIEAETQELRYPLPGDEFDKILASREELRNLACPLGDFLAECAVSLWRQRLKQRMDKCHGG